MRTYARAALLGTAAAALFTTQAAAQNNPGAPPTGAPIPATAQPNNNAQTQNEAAAASDQQIVVTARRRNEILLNVPVAVTAYSGEQLDRQGALDITDVADTTPNVNLEVSRGTNSTLTAFIRGVGQQDPVAGFEQGVGIYLDDVYLNRPQGAVLDIYDVERIEVLRGPQGTLYGRNTIGGAIKYVTRRLDSDAPHVRARANLGTYKQADFVASFSVPATSSLRFGGSFARLSRGGFGKNLTTGKENYNKDIWAVRGTAEFEPADRMFFRLSGDWTWDHSNPRGGHRLIPSLCAAVLCGHAVIPVLSDEFDTQGGLSDPKQRVEGGGIALHGEIGLADWLTFRTITAYRKSHSATPIDFDALPTVDVDVPAKYHDHQFSQELQLVAERGPLHGVMGFYYLDANAFNVFDVRLYATGPLIGLPGLTAATRGNVDTKTWAGFFDLTYDLTPQWSFSMGWRYTRDHRHATVVRANLRAGGSPELGGSPPFDATGIQVGALTSNFDGERTDKKMTPRLSLSFKPTPDHNIYVSYSQGFKGGGFDPRGLTTAAPDLNGNGIREPNEIFDYMAFDPETVSSYEAGWKASLFDRRFQFALAVFRADYQDVQIPGSAGAVINGVPTFVGVTTNAAKARFSGVELETNWRVARDMAIAGDRLSLAGTLGYLDAKFLKYTTIVGFDPVTGLPLARPIEFDVADFRKIQNTPKWTLSGTLDYDVPVASGRLNLNSTVSYRSKSQQFELAIPGLDQKGFALWDANIVWRSNGGRYEFGVHAKNLLNKRYIVSGYNFLRQNPFTGQFINAAGAPALSSALGLEGVLTGFYGDPRRVWASLGVNF